MDNKIINNKRILVVDDNKQAYTDIKRLLWAEPRDCAIAYVIDYTIQGEEALTKIETAENTEQPYALIFMDMHIPPDIKGIEIISRIGNKYPHIEMVICSAYTDYNWQELVELPGFTDKLLILKKPFSPLEIQQLTRSLITKWNLARQVRDCTDEIEKITKETMALQKELLYKTKMADLGRLIAGIAHEINTPLSAIKGTVSSLELTAESLLANYSDFLHSLSKERINMFESLIEKGFSTQKKITTRLERKYRNNLMQILENNNINNTGSIAMKLIKMGIYENIEPFIELIQNDAGLQLLDFAILFTSQFKSRKIIIVAVERISKMVMALKKYSHFDNSGKKKKVILEEGIETVLDLYYNHLKQGINVVKDFKKIPPIFCYPDELVQVWTNLISNAIDAINNQGELKIEIQQDGANVIVSFTDTGTGIPSEAAEKIFQPFFTTKEQGMGSGLGLDISKKIVEKHNGTIDFTSIPGKTTFRVHLPIEE